MAIACTRCGLLHPVTASCFSLALPLGQHPVGLSPHTMLAGRYQILKVIHCGGMSTVYLAEDLLQHREVALKELRLADGATAEEVLEAEAWFARESFLMSVLRHPLIPAFYSVFREDNRSYIVQEFVAGENLEVLVDRQGPLPARTVVTWGMAICNLLSYLHDLEEPVVFRDLKPANILLRQHSDTLAVVDFGIARSFEPAQVGTVVGTPGYAPPEQYQGQATPQSDIYALGATLHRLLTGYDPEQGLPFTFPAAHELNPLVSPELAAIVARATRLHPGERFASAAEMKDALAVSATHSSGAGMGRLFNGQPSGASRNQWHPALAFLLMAVLLPALLLRSASMASMESPFVNAGYMDYPGVNAFQTVPPSMGQGCIVPAPSPQGAISMPSDVPLPAGPAPKLQTSSSVPLVDTTHVGATGIGPRDTGHIVVEPAPLFVPSSPVVGPATMTMPWRDAAPVQFCAQSTVWFTDRSGGQDDMGWIVQDSQNGGFVFMPSITRPIAHFSVGHLGAVLPSQ